MRAVLHTRILEGLFVGTAMLVGGAARGSAQQPFLGGTLGGFIDVGGRGFTNRPSDLEWAKFGEYQNRGSGAYLPGALFTFASGDRLFAELRASDVGRDDQRFSLRAYRPGRFTLDASWDQTPHIYSTNSRSYGADLGANTFLLPSPRPTNADFNNAAVLPTIGTRWDAARVALGVTPTTWWNLKAEYAHIGKTGERPMGMAFGSPGNNHREILEPIDNTTQDFRLSQGFARSHYRLQMGYSVSTFRNAADQVSADNPASAVDVANGAPAAGRTALAPSSTTHSFSVVGTAADFPLKTRVTGSFSYAWWTQNAAFLPYTDNSATTTYTVNSVVIPIPAPPSGLNGDKRTLNLAVGATSTPARNLHLSARYRRFEMEDKTPDLSIPLLVINDRSVTVGPIERERYSHARNNGRFEATWQPDPLARIKLGWNWDQWDREAEREAPRTNDHTPRAAVDLSLTNWLSLQTAVSHSWRRYDTYTQVAAGQNPDIRKFDMANRNQDRLDVTARLNPPGQLGRQFDVGLSYSYGRNDYRVGTPSTPPYPYSVYGMRNDHNWAAGADGSWTPSERVRLHGAYMRERIRVEQLSRSRVTGLLTNTTYDWLANSNDDLHTATAGADVMLIPDRLEGGARWTFYDARTDMLTSNPQTPTGGTAAQNAQAVAANFPTISHKLNTLDASLRYHFVSKWSATVHYVFERWDDSDVRSNGLLPSTGADIFLGNDLLPYRAGYITVTLGYTFGGTSHPLMSP